MKRCQRGTGKKTLPVLNSWHGFFLQWPSEIEIEGHTHQSYFTTLHVFYCPGKIGHLETFSGKHQVPRCHGQAVPRPGGLAAVHEATSLTGPPCNLGSHCWESSDKARRRCGKTHAGLGLHFSSSPRAGSCLSYAAAVLIPINLPC